MPEQAPPTPFDVSFPKMTFLGQAAPDLQSSKTEKLLYKHPLENLHSQLKETGGHVVSQWDVRNLPKWIEMYAEYERSFGNFRDMQYTITHAPQHLRDVFSPEFSRRNYEAKQIITNHSVLQETGVTEKDIEDAQKDYAQLADEVVKISVSEDEKEVEDFTSKIIAFREKYPWMYPTKKRTFKILK